MWGHVALMSFRTSEVRHVCRGCKSGGCYSKALRCCRPAFSGLEMLPGTFGWGCGGVTAMIYLKQCQTHTCLKAPHRESPALCWGKVADHDLHLHHSSSYVILKITFCIIFYIPLISFCAKMKACAKQVTARLTCAILNMHILTEQENIPTSPTLFSHNLPTASAFVPHSTIAAHQSSHRLTICI